MLCVLIDHNDSFTYNLKAYLNSNSIEVIIVPYRTLNKLKLKNFDFLILSAGPGNPNDYPHTYKFIKKYIGNKPIFGVCLGMQIILTYIYKLKLIKIKPAIHGKVSEINVIDNNSLLFKNIKKAKVARYHSLGFKYNNEIFVKALYKNYIMAIEDKNLKLSAIQYHIESFLSQKKDLFLKNFIKLVKSYE